jgi:hypothetical protein
MLPESPRTTRRTGRSRRGSWGKLPPLSEEQLFCAEAEAHPSLGRACWQRAAPRPACRNRC